MHRLESTCARRLVSDPPESYWRRLDLFVENCPLKTLHAVSALGTMLSFYNVGTDPDADIQPESIPFDPAKPNDVAPKARWAYDFLTPSGEEQLRAVVEEIKTDCVALSST